jgi:hypothetical protein
MLSGAAADESLQPYKEASDPPGNSTLEWPQHSESCRPILIWGRQIIGLNGHSPLLPNLSRTAAFWI